MKRKQDKSPKKRRDEEERRLRAHEFCDYCGRRIEDRNDTGSLCYRCYMKEYYGREY